MTNHCHVGVSTPGIEQLDHPISVDFMLMPDLTDSHHTVSAPR
jgi:hypothetical protein